jgi:hypothetical protein
MAINDVMLSQLPKLANIKDSSELYVIDNGVSYSINVGDLTEYMKGKMPTYSRGSMRLNASVTQSISDDAIPVLLNCVDTEVTAKGDFTCNTTTKSITYTGPGSDAILSVGLNVRFPGTEEIELYLYINDVEYSSQAINVQGKGTTKPVEIYWESDVNLVTGDVMDIRGRNADTGSFDLTFLRTTFRAEIGV